MPEFLTEVFYVTRYFRTLMYGGPEEGGWWYDHCSLDVDTPSRIFGRQEDAEDACRALNSVESAEAEKREYNYTSVLSEGDFPYWTIESARGEEVTTSRPRYE